MTSAYQTSQSEPVPQTNHSIAGTVAPSAQAGRGTVILVGPPWPRSGSARVFQNQVDYYRSRGFFTLFLFVPVHSSFVPTHPDWDKIKEGIQEVGADRSVIAPINNSRFVRSKYSAWLKHGFRGTALDWVINTERSAELPEDVERHIAAAQVDLVHVNHVFTLQFARDLVKRLFSRRRPPMLVETHDVQSHLMHGRKDINPWTHKFDSVDALVRSEVAHLRKANILLHCSTDDYNFFSQRLPRSRHVLALPTVDERFAAAVRQAQRQDPIDLLFVGQSTDINFSAIEWLLQDVWPLLSARQYALKIVGPVDALIRERRPDLHSRYTNLFTGPASDLVPYYCSARCVIAPMVSGTGISVKTIEALGLGKPFVGTSKAFRGMPPDRVALAGFLNNDTPEKFAAAIQDALAHEDNAASASCALYDDLFSRKSVYAARDNALQLAGIQLQNPPQGRSSGTR